MPTNATPSDKALNIVLAWLVPGLGHIRSGHRRIGVGCMVIIGSLFGLGLVLSEFSAISRELNPFSFFAQIGFGSGTLITWLLDPAKDLVQQGSAAISTLKQVSRFMDAGLLFCNVAGLLNSLVVVDLLDRSFASEKDQRKIVTGKKAA